MAQGKVFSTGLEQLFDDDDLVCTHRKPLAQKPVKQVCDMGKTGLVCMYMYRQAIYILYM